MKVLPQGEQWTEDCEAQMVGLTEKLLEQLQGGKS